MQAEILTKYDLPTLPSSSSSQLPTLPLSSQSPKLPSETIDIEVERYGDFFRDINYGFILEQSTDIYLLIQETEKYLQRKLTDDDFNIAFRMGLNKKKNKIN